MKPVDPNGEQAPTSQGVYGSLARYPLLDALTERRSRRFGKGMSLNGGPLAYQSTHAPQPLSIEEEAALAFAGCGITGFALAELPYESGNVPEAGGGNIMTHLVSRTVASGDAMHNITLFVLNDEGVWMLKRPQDYPRDEIAGLSRRHASTVWLSSTRRAGCKSPTDGKTCRARCPSWRHSTSGRPTFPPLPTSCRLPNAAPFTSTSCSRPSARSSATSWWTNATASSLRI